MSESPAPGRALDRLIPFGRLLLEGSLDGAERTAQVLEREVGATDATWWETVRTGTEQFAGAYFAALDDPATEPAVLEAARADLEALFAASAALGEPLPTELHERVAARDDELETRLG